MSTSHPHAESSVHSKGAYHAEEKTDQKRHAYIPGNKGQPVHSSARMHPKDHMSISHPYDKPKMISGDLCAQVWVLWCGSPHSTPFHPWTIAWQLKRCRGASTPSFGITHDLYYQLLWHDFHAALLPVRSLVRWWRMPCSTQSYPYLCCCKEVSANEDGHAVYIPVTKLLSGCVICFLPQAIAPFLLEGIQVDLQLDAPALNAFDGGVENFMQTCDAACF
eukprot:1159706-Pelagomonas_calceolata.AAC.7